MPSMRDIPAPIDLDDLIGRWLGRNLTVNNTSGCVEVGARLVRTIRPPQGCGNDVIASGSESCPDSREYGGSILIGHERLEVAPASRALRRHAQDRRSTVWHVVRSCMNDAKVDSLDVCLQAARGFMSSGCFARADHDRCINKENRHGRYAITCPRQ